MSSRSVPSNTGDIQTMTISAHLHAAVDQCIDALCFSGTHALDTDLRAQPKASQSSFDRLAQEQQRRVDEAFGPQSVTAETLACALDELFKIDSSSISDRSDEPGHQVSPVVDIMTDTTAKIFKKEMKQRIHEWEGAFRDQFGREPTPSDKNRLKHIYELYKVVKNRVLKGAPGEHHQQPQQSAGAATPNSVTSGASQLQQQQQQQPSHQRTTSTGSAGGGLSGNAGGGSRPSSAPSTSQPQSVVGAATPVRATSANPITSMPSPLSMTPGFNNINNNIISNAHQQQQQGATASLGANVQLTPMGQNTPSANTNIASRPGSQPGSRAATPTNTNVPANQQQQQQQLAGSSPPPAGVTTTKSQFDQLVVEKRALKRRLHAFEGDFQKQHGRAPTRDDRLPLIQSYQRYGELKMAIQAYQTEHGVVGGDD